MTEQQLLKRHPLALAVFAALNFVPAAHAVSPDIVISQVYGGGGNSGATLKNDFIELFNRGNSTVSLAGMSVQYASSTGTSWQKTNLTGTLQPGQYYLVQEAVGAGGTVNLPTPDAIGTILMSATTGKVALVSNQTALTGSCPTAGVTDFVGFGGANCSETSPTPVLTNTTADLRASNGCTDTDNNSSDFSTGAPNPRNTTSALNPCSAPTTPTVNLSVSANAGSEADTTVITVTATASAAVTSDQTVNLAVTGTGITAGDYTLSSTIITIPNGSTTGSVIFTVANDALVEGTETAILTLSSPSAGISLGATTTQNIAITDSNNACGDPATKISAVQGNGSASPLAGTVQHIEAVVVGDFQGSTKLNGFFVQEEDSDADNNPATSEGLFVSSNSTVNTGDKVHVVGTVSETFNMTRLESVTSVGVCSTGNPLPTTTNLSLPFDAANNNPEWREGMLVNLPQTLTVSENFNLARFGELLVSSGGRLMIPTQVVSPGAEAVDYEAQNLLNQLIIDDGSNVQNPDPVVYPAPAGLSAANTLRSGYTISNALGILAYDFGVYRLQPIEAPVFHVKKGRTITPPALPGIGSLKVASFNVLNYFNGNGDGVDGVDGGFPTARGANTLVEFNRQRSKIIAAINQLDADVIGLMELENDGYDAKSAIADLVNGLNAIAGTGTYDYIDPGVNVIGTDQITVGLIYKPAKASLIGNAAILDSTINPLFIDTKNRPALAQTFQDRSSNKRLTVAVNHLKSKGSDCEDINDRDTGDGQGNCNLTRTDAATALADWLNNDPTGSGENNFLIIGDLNSYAKEDPITALHNGGFQNLLENFTGNSGDMAAYSFVFKGEAGYLDHALANPGLFQQVKGIEEWHINADEPRALDYNTEFKSAGQVASFFNADAYRSSDHDPLLLEVFVPGDLDNDGDVDDLDVNRFRSSLGKCSGASGFIRETDYDQSQCTTYGDYRIWYGFYKSYLAKAAQ